MDSRKKRRLVISAVNFTEGGPLTILRDALNSAVQSLGDDWEIIALVHKKELAGVESVRYVEVPLAKKSWLLRLVYEWFVFYRWSKRWNVDVWLALHDITPRVCAGIQAVYCHNPAPFYRLTFREATLDFRFMLFNLLYGALYGVFIKRNRFVVVQQDWIRKEFQSRYKCQNVIVAHPLMSTPAVDVQKRNEQTKSNKIFFFPAFPRVFKNHQVVAEAAQILGSRGYRNFEVRFTITGCENAYSRYLRKRFADSPGVVFVGLLDKPRMDKEYRQCDVVIFPSKLETWGLPISEAKACGKPILLADLPYAHETLGAYRDAAFFSPNDPYVLANLMEQFLLSRWIPRPTLARSIGSPYAHNWTELWQALTGCRGCET